MKYSQTWLDEAETSLHFALVGKLQYGQFNDLQTRIFELKDNPPADITFDLTDVEFIDSSGMGLLLLANDMTPDDHKVTVKYPNPGVHQILHACKIDVILNVVL